MTQEEFIDQVLSRIPHTPRRQQIEMDLRAHIAERLEHGQTVDEAIAQFGDPDILAESYLASIPLVSASFLDRAAAKLIDIPAILVTGAAFLWAIWQLVGPPGQPFIPGIVQTESPIVRVVCLLALVVMCPGYFIFSEYLTDQTLGKRMLGLRVVRESGARIGLGQSVVRQLPLVGSFFLLDVLFAPFTDKHQRAFELITKTRVVRVDDAIT
jgi:uncharacterized RDD family membrane protein YckC